MRQFLVLFALLCSFRVAAASPSSVWWPAWTISSSEELSDGIEYSKNSYTPSFPLSFLFDNDAKTAWVYSAQSKEFFAPFQSRYGIQLEPKKPIEIDGLRLMNGQNANRARFMRNKRVTKIRVTMEAGKQKIVRTFALPDAMGFHNISLPRRKINSLKIEFVGLKNGTGDNDLCISELQLTNNGQKIGMHMPRAVMFYDGLEGCGFSFLIRDESELAIIALDSGGGDAWSRNGRYVSGVSGGRRGKTDYLWIADAQTGTIARRFSYGRFAYDQYAYFWEGDTLQVTLLSNNKKIHKLFTPPFFKP